MSCLFFDVMPHGIASGTLPDELKILKKHHGASVDATVLFY